MRASISEAHSHTPFPGSSPFRSTRPIFPKAGCRFPNDFAYATAATSLNAGDLTVASVTPVPVPEQALYRC